MAACNIGRRLCRSEQSRRYCSLGVNCICYSHGNEDLVNFVPPSFVPPSHCSTPPQWRQIAHFWILLHCLHPNQQYPLPLQDNWLDLQDTPSALKPGKPQILGTWNFKTECYFRNHLIMPSLHFPAEKVTAQRDVAPSSRSSID